MANLNEYFGNLDTGNRTAHSGGGDFNVPKKKTI